LRRIEAQERNTVKASQEIHELGKKTACEIDELGKKSTHEIHELCNKTS
jgi:DNA-binding transcriptional regulator YbjK